MTLPESNEPAPQPTPAAPMAPRPVLPPTLQVEYMAPPGPRPVPGPVLAVDYMDVRRLPSRRGWRAAVAKPGFWPLLAFAWVLLGAAVVGGVGFAVGATFDAPALSVMTGLILLLLLTSAALLLRNLRRSRAQAVLAYLEQAVRLNLPLPAMLLAAEGAEAAPLRRQLLRLRERLEDGAPVAAALDSAVTGLPDRAVGLIDFGERTGRLGAALRRLVREPRFAQRSDPSGQILIRWYPLVMLVATFNVATLICIFVAPRFKSILSDFHLPVPTVSRLLDQEEWLLFIGPVVSGLVLLVYLGRLTGEMVSPRLSRYSPVRGLTDRLAWYVPPARGVTRWRVLADACNVLADALSAGQAPHRALEEAAGLPLNTVLKRKLKRWAAAAEGGMPLAEGARQAGLPALVAGMLSTAPAADGAEQVLRFLARYYESRFGRASQLLRGAVVPLLAILFGALAAALALSIFLPLVEMIDKLAPPGGGPM